MYYVKLNDYKMRGEKMGAKMFVALGLLFVFLVYPAFAQLFPVPQCPNILRIASVSDVSINQWLTPYDVAISKLPKTTTVTLVTGQRLTVNLTWLSITDPQFPEFKYNPATAASTPSYKATARVEIPKSICSAEVKISANLSLASPVLPGIFSNAGIYPDGRTLKITDRTLFNLSGTYKTVSLYYGGLSRSYHYYVPSTYNPSKAVPLVIVLHGAGSCGLGELLVVDDFAKKYGFIAVAPDGYNYVWLRTRDVSFISKIIDDMKASFNISKVYVAGISNGGMMASYLLYDLYNKIDAVGVISGPAALESLASSSAPPKPMNIVVTAGTDERLSTGGNMNSHISARNAVSYLVLRLNCNPTPATQYWPSTAEDRTYVTKYEYSGCRNNAKVVYFEIGNGGHAWPGGLQYLIPSAIGWVTKHVNAWDDCLMPYFK
ncbi:MAG: hypothetical protein QXW66_04370 [Archaeoglobaceae archaeon]